MEGHSWPIISTAVVEYRILSYLVYKYFTAFLQHLFFITGMQSGPSSPVKEDYQSPFLLGTAKSNVKETGFSKYSSNAVVGRIFKGKDIIQDT